MRKLIYGFGVSLDGYINDRDGNIDWTDPDEELHQFHNDRYRQIEISLHGRRLYELDGRVLAARARRRGSSCLAPGVP